MKTCFTSKNYFMFLKIKNRVFSEKNLFTDFYYFYLFFINYVKK